MPTVQIIELYGSPAAIVIGDMTIIANAVPAALLAHVQAKALYALQIHTGDTCGPYTDAAAERYARTAVGPPAGAQRLPSRLRRRGQHRR